MIIHTLYTKQMKESRKFATYIFFLSLLLTRVFAASPEVTINYVSSTLNSYTQAQGSQGGGTVLYISGSNFSPIAGDIRVYIGSYPCDLIAEGSTVSMVSCITTPMLNPDSQYSLSVTMYTANLLPVTCQLKVCQFSYSEAKTPFIYEVFPSTAVGNQQITLYGNHKITNVGDGRSPSGSDLRYIIIETISCSTLDIIQEDISTNSDSIYCKTFLYQPAGEYNITERVVHGDALYSVRAWKTSFFTGRKYIERIAPLFEASTVQSGGTYGHILTFSGIGYETNPSDLARFTCKIGSIDCTVISNQKGFIQVQLPPYAAGFETSGKLPKDPTDASSTQENPYLGSYGFRYTRYSYTNSKSLDQSLLDFRAGTSTETILQEGVRTQLGHIYSGKSTFNDYLRGYFYAPVDGSYLFECSVDDVMVVYMSSVSGSSNPENMVLIMRVDSYMTTPEDPYRLTGRNNAVTKVLKAGYYYMEVVARDYSGGNFYYVSVSLPTLTIPNSGQLANPTWKIENIVIAPTNVLPEIITVTVNIASLPAGTTTYKLYYYTKDSTGNFVQVSSGNIAVKATATQFRSAIGSLPHFSGYGLTVSLTMLDSSDAVTQVEASAEKFVYQISYPLTRHSSYTKLPHTSVTAGITVVTSQVHSPGIDGGYTFSLSGVPLSVFDPTLKASTTTIQVSNYQNLLQSALRTYYQSNEIWIFTRNTPQRPDQLDFDILYQGVLNPETVTISTTGMTGGTDDAITVTITTRREFSAARPFFSAIPYEFLRVAAPLPSVLISYNDIPAVCLDCLYEYQPISPITIPNVVFAADKTTLDIGVVSSDIEIFNNFALSDITVTLYGQPCVVDSGTTSSFVCRFNTIQCGGATVPKLPAGSGYAKVHIKQLGFFFSDNLLNKDLIITALTPIEIGVNGGVVVTASGTGFPISNNSPSKLTITTQNSDIIGSIVLTSVSNCEVQFTFPPQTTLTDLTTTLIYKSDFEDIEVTKNDDANEITLSPDHDPSVTALSIQSASPILKQNIDVTGTNFDLDASKMKVFLYFASNLTQKYELGILSVASTTSMTVVLGGGRSGEYYLRVLVIGKGMSAPTNANKLSYEIVVGSISPVTGSISGGYTMTITGSNFATAEGSTQVFIGDGINSICLITAITATSIECTVPQMHGDYKIDQNKLVLVTGRLIENSRCVGTCTFSYSNTDTVYVSLSGGPKFASGNAVTITTNSSFSSTPAVKVGDTTVALTSSTDTSITFPYPYLSAGSHLITVTVGGANAYPKLQTATDLTIGQMSSLSGSNKGQIVSVSGNGFSSITSKNNVINYICSGVTVVLPIISIVPNNVTFQIPSSPSQTCVVNVTMGLTFKSFNYQQSSAKTPSVTVTDQGSKSYKIVASNTNSKAIKFIVIRYLNSNGGVTTSTYPMSWTEQSTNNYLASPTGNYLPAGTFIIDVSFDTLGFADSSTNQFTIAPTAISALTPDAATSSFGGQGTYTLTSEGFITDNIQNNEVTVCGIRANIISADESSLTFRIPAFVNAQTRTNYGLGTEMVLTSSGNFISDTTVQVNYAFDSNIKSIYSSSNSVCYTGLDFGTGAKALITKIRYMPNTAWIRLDQLFDGAVLEGSNDNSVWTTIFTVDSQLIHTGWNVWLATNEDNIFRSVRFRQTDGDSKCELAELEVSGIIYSTTAYAASLPCDVKVNFFNGVSSSFSNAITYSDTATSAITGITPTFGPSTGGTVITIAGSNFATTLSDVSIVIDGITCTVTTATATQIQCTTGARLTPPAGGNSFVAKSAGNTIVLKCEPFLYMDRWSSQATWGGEVPPREGDTVYVPQGMTLLVDQSTPFLNTIIVEGGKIVFADETDMTVDANYFIMIGGEFRAGLPSAPYQHKLTITLHGGYYDKQLPYFGNKVLGCMNCRFNMHGIVRTPTWTQLTATINPGDNQLTLLDAVDWAVGESIAVAASGYNHFESEQKTITAVSENFKTLTVDTPFTYRHFSGTENHGGKDFVMNAEVGLLTRNIVIQGDSRSDIQNHGSHLIFMGKVANGLDATLSYTEIRRCGQPKIIARYCSHFHLAGEVPDSFVRGIAVHHSHARVLTIHGTHYLTVEKNVGYLVEGHNIFVEDGIETHNIIQNNLMISTIASQTMLQSDTSPAGYWITNPLNTVRNNHAAGGDFYGFWYEIKPNPDGPSATPNICPTGMMLGESKNNVAHSQRRFGLRIFNYAARQYPCLPLVDQALVNPFEFNPAIQSVFDNYLLWKNAENGLLGEVLGYVTLSNFLIIDSGASGMQFFATNVSLQNVTAKQSIIVGYSTGNAPSDMTTLDNVRGIITPRTDGFRADDVTFVNFGAQMTPLQSCSKCESILFQVTGGKTSFFNNIKYSNILGNYIFWNNWRREIFIDEDGSLTKPITDYLSKPQGSSGTITPYFDHLKIPDHCYNIVPLWDNSSYCDETITIRSLLYTNANPSQDFVGQTIRTFKMESLDDPDEADTFDVQPMIIIKKSHDIPGSWAFPYAVGYNYHTHFQMGIDFLHLSLAPSQYWLESEAIIVKFNYTDQRQLFKIGKYYSQALQTPLITDAEDLASLDIDACENGDYYHDKVGRYLYVCVTGRSKTLREWIDITGIRCLDFCPKSSSLGPRETFNRVWSNVSQWPNQELPTAGQNVTIPYEWNLVLDISPPAFYYVLINGLLFFDRKDLTFEASTIWVQQGGIFIGTPTNPFTHKATIILKGDKSDLFTVLDPEASGNKMLAVTGALQFYGSPPAITWTRLTAIAAVGATTITVQDLDGWNIDDQIVIGSTYSGQAEDETFKIVSISDKTITLDGALAFQHFGSADPLTNSKGGVIDMRAAVGLLTRNIKITRREDANNWGCRVQVYSYIMEFEDANKIPMPVNGYVYFNGVELDGCGQYGSSNAGLRIQKLGSLMETTNPTKILSSTIRNCNGYCVYIDKASNVTFDNNIIYFGRRYLVFVLTVSHYAFINNALIGLRINPDVKAQLQGTGLAPNNAAYEQYLPVNPDTDNVTVTGNLVQGSEDNGFVFPFTSCDKISSYPFKGNTAGSCFVAFITNVLPGKKCIAAAGFSGYASYIGFIANPPGVLTEVQYEDMFFTDNSRGFTLRFAHEIDDNTIKLSNSYFMGYSRPSCPACYSSTKLSYCNDGHAIRMFTATLSGETFPFNKNMSGFDVICTQEAFDAKAFLTNITFENYKFDANSAVPYCTNMNVFRRHDLASDATAVHNLYETSCVNCDKNSLAYFEPANPAWRGWSGGCGQLDCTGPINYFIHDHTGHFTQPFNNDVLQPSQLMANNEPIGDNEAACTKVSQWNGYWCKFEQLALLEYQSIAADFNKRMVWPITLKYDGGSWTSITNGWREWSWIAPGDAANTRLARFWSVVKLGEVYNMTYASQPPSDAVYQIQKRSLPTGNPEDWVIIRIYFPVPNVVLVRATNTTGKDIVVPGFQQINGVYPDLKDSTDNCGANYYSFETNTIHFVVNGISNCKVRLTISSYVQLTIRFQIEMAAFYNNNGPTSVLTNIIAFLNIDPSQIKIVGINSGSTIVRFNLLPSSGNKPVDVSSNSSDPYTEYFVTEIRDPVEESNELNTLNNKLTAGLKSKALDLDFDIMSVSSKIKIVSTSNQFVTVCPDTFIYDQETQMCRCDPGYIEINNVCVACSTIGNSSVQTDPDDFRRCTCKPSFVWSDTLKACYCREEKPIIDIDGLCFSCKGLVNGTGLAESASNCKCNPSFVFFANNNTCACPDFNSYILNKVCYSCSSFGNGTGKVAVGNKNCECLPTYVYLKNACTCPQGHFLSLSNTCVKCQNSNCKCPTGKVFKPATSDCRCPTDNSAYFKNVCTPCAASSSMTGAVNAAGTECVCRATFIWKANRCQCSHKNMIIFENACVSCLGTAKNYSGKGAAPGNQCSCKSQYTWVPETASCICGVNSMFNSSNGNCYICSQFSNTVVSTQSELDSCQCVNNLVFDPIKFVCYCTAATDIIRQQTCVSCTSSIINGVVKTNPTTCSCSALLNRVWNKNTQTCVCKAGYFARGATCAPCNTIQFSTATSSLGVSCVCKPTFTWNPTTSTCGCDSNSVLSAVVAKSQTCISCDAYVGSSGIDPLDSTKCICLGDLVWNAEKKICDCATTQPNQYFIISADAKCVPCSTETDPYIVNPPINKYNCKCADPYFWDNLQTKCVLCTSIANGLAKTKLKQLICPCLRNFYFDIYTNRCIPVKTPPCVSSNIASCLSCSAIPYTYPSSGPGPLTDYMMSKDTKNVIKQYSTLSSINSKYVAFQCYCAGGFEWEPVMKRCNRVAI